MRTYFDDILKLFCSNDETRQILQVPNTENGYVYATNGHIMIRVSSKDCKHKYPSNPKYPNCKKIIDDCERYKVKFTINVNDLDQAIKEIPKIDVYKKINSKCPECDGDGVVKCEVCGHKYQCVECDGRRFIEKNSDEIIGQEVDSTVLIKLSDSYFSIHTLNAVLETAKIIKVNTLKISKSNNHLYSIVIETDNSIMVIMPMQRNEEKKFVECKINKLTREQ